MKHQFILALEITVGWGSMSIFEHETCLGGQVFDRDNSGSEDLIWHLDHLLKCCDVRKHDIDKLIVSANSNNYAGTRSRLAAVKGIAEAWRIRVQESDILRILVNKYRDQKSDLLLVLPERNSNTLVVIDKVGEVNFEVKQIKTDNLHSFIETIEISEPTIIVTSQNFVQDFKTLIKNKEILIAEDNLSYFMKETLETKCV